MSNLSKVSKSNNLMVPTLDEGFHQYLQKINNIPSLTEEEEFLLAKAYLEGKDLKAAQTLVQSHLKLVAKIALQYKNYGLPIADLVSEGNMGLMHAVKKYDPYKGNRLSTYAMWWIKAAVQEYILKSWSLIKIGTSAAQKKLFFSLGKLKRKISNTHAREVNSNDMPSIANALGVSLKEVEDMDNRLSNADMSLNSKPGNDDNSSEFIDTIVESRPSQETALIIHDDSVYQRRILASALAKLEKRELDILSNRRLKDAPSTLEELSIRYNISKERVRQIENKAFEKIRGYVLESTKSQQLPPVK